MKRTQFTEVLQKKYIVSKGRKGVGYAPTLKKQDKRFNNDVYMYICMSFILWNTDYDTV